MKLGSFVVGALLFPVGAMQTQERSIAPVPQLTLSDSAAILREVWAALARGHRGLREARLWTPSARDATVAFATAPELRRLGVFEYSDALRQRLSAVGIPMFDRRRAGSDTVVFHLTRWRQDPSEVQLDFMSSWTTVLSSGCRTGSMNVERVHVRRHGNTWRARRGAVMHGDEACGKVGEGGTEYGERGN